MIFKHLFRSKHQNPDPQVRKQAIENLNHEDPEQKSILHELAFNDSDVSVSLAALNKLNSFVLWYKMAEIAKNQRVQKKSQQFVEQTLLDEHNDYLAVPDKRKFILEVKDPQLIEKLLAQTWIQADTELALALIQKVDKPQLFEKLLFASQNQALNIALLDCLTDSAQSRKLLNKVQKKACSESLKNHAEQKLHLWLEAERAPKRLEQQCSMLLSRLLALKELTDLPAIQSQQQALNQHYAELQQQFACLSPAKRQEIEQKHADINSRIERTIKLLLPKWQAQQTRVEQQAKVEQLRAKVHEHLAFISRQLSDNMSQLDQTDIANLVKSSQQHHEQLSLMIAELPSTERTEHKQLEALAQQLLSSSNTLNRIPEFQQAKQAAEQLIDGFAKLDLPTDISQLDASLDYLQEQKCLWRDTVQAYQSHLPTELLSQWQQLTKDWQQSVNQLKKQIQSELTRCRSKLKAIDSLITQGKFKAAMGLYQKVQVWFAALPEKQQAQLERLFNSTQDKIENLKDWQDYIAAPRKPALLEQVQSLIDNPLAIPAQADAIKSLRYQWNSLGKTDSEADQALNAAFETAIEQAFAPCRAFYDQQQQEREQNLKAKQELLAKLDAINLEQQAEVELVKQVNKLQQQWRNIGEVDFKQRELIYQQFQQKLAPLKAKVNQFYTDNAEKKQLLVKQAEKLSQLENMDEAVEQAKHLQTKWKSIEHAGKKSETELWNAFRQANDALFNQRAEANKAQKQEIKQQVELINSQLDDLEQGLTPDPAEAGAKHTQQLSQEIRVALSSLPMREQKALSSRLQNILEQQDKLQKQRKQNEQQRQLGLVFSCLKAWTNSEQKPVAVNELNKQWQSCFSTSAQKVDRHALCIKMEIVAQVDSPQEEQATRQNLQMQMMAEKLQSGVNTNLKALLKQWISGGALTEQDLSLIPRIEKLFVGH